MAVKFPAAAFIAPQLRVDEVVAFAESLKLKIGVADAVVLKSNIPPVVVLNWLEASVAA